MKNVVAVVLAGGKGSRLEPLTRDRAKPAVPFGGIYRIVDFTLSNCLNSGIRKMLLLTQYKAMSLDRHVNYGWRKYFCHELGEFIDVVPPQQRIDEHWYQGTADAVYQNIYVLEQATPEHVIILAGDHIYKMDYRAMLEHHVRQSADLTVAALPVSPREATSFGVMEVDDCHRLRGFEEKPASPRTMPGSDQLCLASMGIYIFSSRVLFETLCRDANLPHSSHDFGRDIIPSMIHTHRVVAYPFPDLSEVQRAYWRDVGTLDAYYRANMDLVSVEPQLNLYDETWPIRTRQYSSPPPKFVFGSHPDVDPRHANRVGCAIDSIVCPGTIVSGAQVKRSVIGCNVVLRENSVVTDSIIFDRVTVGKNVVIHNSIIDKDVVIPDGTQIGVDPVADRQKQFFVTDDGVVVIARGDRVSMADQRTGRMSPHKWHIGNRIVHDQ